MSAAAYTPSVPEYMATRARGVRQYAPDPERHPLFTQRLLARTPGDVTVVALREHMQNWVEYEWRDDDPVSRLPVLYVVRVPFALVRRLAASPS